MLRMSAKWSVISCIVVLSVGALSVLAPPVEAQIAKSGTGTIHSGFKAIGTTTPIGDKRMYWTGAYWGVSFNDEGKGFLHQLVWHCPAISDIHNNMITTKGSCMLTDTDGDKFGGEWTGKGPVGGEFSGAITLSSGTGKYTGIQGGWDFHCWGVGTDDQVYCRQQYNYKSP